MSESIDKRSPDEPTRNNPSPDDVEYETDPNAPYNRQTERHLGHPANERPVSREDEIERTKQYSKGGTRP